MSSGNESGCVKVIGVLAGIATIIGVIIAFLAWAMPFSPSGSSPLASRSTDQPANDQSVSTEIPPIASEPLMVPPTPTSPPTELPPTPTPSPTELPPTPIPDTSPGTILDVGQSWRQAGFELRLADSRQPDTINVAGVEIRFVLTSYKAHDVSMRYSLAECISAHSNQGQRLDIGFSDLSSFYSDFTHPFSDSFETIATPIQDGQSLDLYAKGDYFDNEWVIIVADTADPYLTEIIVTFTGLNGIENAQWRIPIYH